ncbi:SdpA family antimicrobial peptide system protein [Paenibacillus sp. IHBB 10380]|uniref:SdpA family antimicrobial peptide system protein n=1 Tax=Paenibacillus sp. IHBB 10380 TaxID=1566358 RepID=UPI0005CF9F7A|nr:SdpA family antimicrobial peptide system protein [Paenibacillus sp. IHBB 10380]AJS59932.1 hypothetical protein UB51_17275 [Paenibacillus sp. IHBB 10380]
MKQRSRGLFVTLCVTSLVVLVLFFYSWLNFLSESVVSASSEKNVLLKIMPQGWSFFSKSPRDDEFVVLDPETLELAVQWPNASAANFFGLSRYGRAQGIEAGTLSFQVPHDQWQVCSGDLKGCMQQGERTVIEVVNSTPNPSLCASYLLVQRKPVPWAWASITTPEEQPSQYVEVIVNCSRD